MPVQLILWLKVVDTAFFIIWGSVALYPNTSDVDFVVHAEFVFEKVLLNKNYLTKFAGGTL